MTLIVVGKGVVTVDRAHSWIGHRQLFSKVTKFKHGSIACAGNDEIYRAINLLNTMEHDDCVKWAWPWETEGGAAFVWRDQAGQIRTMDVAKGSVWAYMPETTSSMTVAFCCGSGRDDFIRSMAAFGDDFDRAWEIAAALSDGNVSIGRDTF